MTKIFKAVIVFLLLVLSLNFFSNQSYAQQAQPTAVHIFTSKTCPHCAEEKQFLKKLAEENSLNFIVYNYDVSRVENVKLIQLLSRHLNFRTGGVPLTLIGQEAFIGFADAQTTGKQVKQLITQASQLPQEEVINPFVLAQENNLDPDYEILLEAKLVLPTQVPESSLSITPQVGVSPQPSLTVTKIPAPDQKLADPTHNAIKLPILGEIDPTKISLPLLTLILGFVDGFNPCAMWTLMFLISLLLGLKNRKKMWLLGIVFIVASGFVYFLFMSAWLNLFLFLGLVIWVRILIGLVAILAGLYYLKDFYQNKTGACKTDLGGKKQKVFSKLKQIVYNQKIWLALVGMVLMAFAVNLVELICSAGFPAVYTHILTLRDLPVWQYYSYIGLYIIVFMLDDIGVFVVAMATLHRVGIDTKYARYSHLIGGILMVLIALALWFKPELLVFGS